MAEVGAPERERANERRVGDSRNRKLAEVRQWSWTKALYAFLFVAVLPALLIAWARATRGVVTAPAIHAPWVGIILLCGGVAMVLSGWAALWRFGGGLPMNIAPPPRFVSEGSYKLLPHPIYTGFCLSCVGLSLSEASASGLWLVTPCVIVGCIALVLGYEQGDLRKRFGELPSILPSDSEQTPQVRDRVACYLFVLIPWLVLYEARIRLGAGASAVSTFLRFERRIPVIEWSEVAYASTYLCVCVAPLLATTRRSLRQFCWRGLLSMAIVFPLFLLVPFVAEPRPFAAATMLGRLLNWERSFDSSVAAFPSYHAIWAVLALLVYEDWSPKYRWVWRGWTAAMITSCVTTGMHSVLDVLAGLVVAYLCLRPTEFWRRLRYGAERLANSWRDWRIGPVRIINHGIYAALAGFVVLFIAGIFAGSDSETILFLVAMCALVTSGLWAQFLEGSTGLLRPFGYFGGFVGVGLGALIGMLLGADFWLVTAALAIGAPWMQAIGRLRCLVQGCCHGRPTTETTGICYRNSNSRVARINSLRGVPIHATPLYSILWNICVGAVLICLWIARMPLHFLCGIYCVLMGLGRFAEEAYRGEPQTPVIAGLRLYQWIAVATVLGGAIITALGKSGPPPAPHWSGKIWLFAFLFSLITGFALGVDFPESNRRFARLA